jgi:hypothetical protein
MPILTGQLAMKVANCTEYGVIWDSSTFCTECPLAVLDCDAAGLFGNRVMQQVREAYPCLGGACGRQACCLNVGLVDHPDANMRVTPDANMSSQPCPCRSQY